MSNEHDALLAMEKYGGGFAHALALAWMRADEYNAARLRKAFPELLQEYEAMARQEQATS